MANMKKALLRALPRRVGVGQATAAPTGRVNEVNSLELAGPH